MSPLLKVNAVMASNYHRASRKWMPWAPSVVIRGMMETRGVIYGLKQSSPGSDNLQNPFPLTQKNDLVLIHSDQPIAQAPFYSLEGCSPMASTPKKWVMQPLSPRLDMKDLRTILSPGTNQTDGKTLEPGDLSYESITVLSSQPSVTVTSKVGDSPQDVVVKAKQVAVSDESSSSDDWQPSSSSCPSSPCSSSGSQTGFYSFEDRSPEVEKTEAWMSSPEREAKLAVLKAENGFKLRAYVEDRKPEKLFEEANGDSRYRVEEVEDAEAQDEIEERREIIRSQAPKVKPAFKGQFSALESLDLTYSPHKLLEGLSLSYSPVKMEVLQTGSEQGTIDTQQISFSAARQQFLKMEEPKCNPFLQSPRQILQFPEHQERPSQSKVTITSGKQDKDGLLEEQLRQSPKSDPDINQGFTGKTVTVSITEERSTKTQSSFDDFDSGLGALSQSLDPIGGNGYDGNASNDVSRVETGGLLSFTSKRESPIVEEVCISQESEEDFQHVLGSKEESPIEEEVCISQEKEEDFQHELGSKEETPIEREIRIAQEREENLRHERGIKRTDIKEMVEIKTKPLLVQESPALTPIKAKEKNRVSFMIQREIEQDSRREEDLQHQGRVPGLYDRGSAQELGERKRVFELQEDQIPVTPTKKILTGNLPDAKPIRSDVEEGRSSPEDMTSVERTRSPEVDTLFPCCPHRHPGEAVLWMTSPEYSMQSPDSQRRGHNTSVLPNFLGSDRERYSTFQSSLSNYSPWHMENRRSASPSASSPSSDTRSRSPLLVPAIVGKPNLNWPGISEQVNLRPRRLDTPDAIREEIEWDLKREEDLRKLRESGGLSLSFDGGLDAIDQTASTLTDAAALQCGEEGRTSQQGLAEEVGGHEKPLSTVLPEEQIAKSGVTSLCSTDTVDSKESHLNSLIPDKGTQDSASPCLSSPSVHVPLRLPSVSMMAPQPWVGYRQGSPALPRVLPLTSQSAGVEAGAVSPQKGLTETLLEDFEERRAKQKQEESSYAGIQPTDAVNNEVLEATRVTRHKNMKALRWEAGMYANEERD